MALQRIDLDDVVKPVYLWTRTLWKGLKPVLIAVLTTAALALLEQVLTIDFLTKYGVPQVAAIAIVAAYNNWRKQHRSEPVDHSY